MNKCKNFLLSLLFGIFLIALSVGIAACSGGGNDGADGADGADGTDGIGIESVEKTGSDGNVDTYTITLSDGSTYTFTVTNGEDGATGATGAQGDTGEDGDDGLSAYEIYIKYNPDYTGTEEEWLEDLINGNLATVSYTVTFDTNGGSAEIESQTVKKGDKVTEPETPAFTGYEFDGWYLGDEKWSFIGYSVTEDITLTAKLTMKNSGLTFTAVYDTENTSEIVSYTVSGYSGTDTEIEIPEYYNGLPVTAIGSAFANNTTITSVTIPESVTSIGAAFNGCSNLTSITISKNVTTMGDNAFNGCSSLTTVNYGGTASQWASISFASDSGNPTYYAKSLSLLDSVTGTYVTATEITIDGIEAISAYAFRNNKALISVTIGESVTTMGDNAFNGCSSLTTVNYGGTASQWASISFASDSGNPANYSHSLSLLNSDSGEYEVATEITIEGITSINANAFRVNTSLTSVTISSGVTTIGDHAFRGCVSLTTVTIPASVISMGTYAFYNNQKLTTVNYGGTASQWASISFGDDISNPAYNAKSLYLLNNTEDNYELATIITIEGIEIINAYAFYNNEALTSVTIGSDVTSIDSNAFCGCTSLTSVTFENTSGWYVSASSTAACGKELDLADATQNAAYLTNNYYSYYWKQTDEVITHTATSYTSYDNTYHYYTCDACSESITEAHTYENGVCACGYEEGTSVGLKYTAVYDTDDNTKIVSYTVSSIGDCEDTDLVIPSTYNFISVTAIAGNAFYSNTTITSVTIPDSVTSIGSCAFYNCSSITSINILDGVTTIESLAFGGCTSLESITIPDDVTSIASNAFQNCPNLTSVYYGGTVAEWSEISIGDTNGNLTSATRYYYSETQPTNCDNYWYYNESGEIVIWDRLTSADSHSLTYVEAKDATCTEDGNIEYWYCSVCGKYFSDKDCTTEITQSGTVIAATGHGTLTHVAAVAATYTTDGNIEYWYCENCGKYYSDADATTEITQADTVIAADPNTYTVTFSNDGSTSTAKYTISTTITLPAAGTIDGYTFGGWYTEADGAGTLFAETTTSTVTLTNTTGDFTVYAYWYVTVTYVYATTDSGTLTTTTAQLAKGVELTAPELTTYTDNDDVAYSLVGWYTDSTFANTYSFGSALTANTTIYARFAISEKYVNGIKYTYYGTNGSTFSYNNSFDTKYSEVIPSGFYAVSGYDSDTLSAYYTEDSNYWLVIESGIDGFEVFATQSSVFGELTTIVNVVLPSTLKYIDSLTFYKCTNLSNLVILADTVYLANINSRSNYPFVGCNSSLNIYCGNYVGLGETDSNVYYYAFDIDGGSNHTYLTPITSWTYYSTFSITSSCDYTTTDIQSDVISVLTTNDFTDINGAAYFYAGSVDITTAIQKAVLEAVNAYTAETNGYINGYAVTVTVSGYVITVTVTANGTAYYLTTVTNSLDNSGTFTLSSYTNNDNGSATVTYTDGKTTVTATITSAKVYSYTTTDSDTVTALYVLSGESVTVTTNVSGITLSSVTYNTTSATGDQTNGFTFTSEKANYTLSLGWETVSASE